MVIRMPRYTVTLAADPDGVRYAIERVVPLPWRPVGLVASGTAPRVCDVAALVDVLFGERWAVN